MSDYKCKICGQEISEYQHNYNHDMCYSCAEDEYYKNLAEDLQKNLQTAVNWEDEVICPYCGYRIEDDEGYYVREGTGEEECPRCGKIFDFEACVEVTYSTSRKEEGDE